MKTTPDHLRPRRAKEESEATSQPSDGAVPIGNGRFKLLTGIVLATGVALHSPEAEADTPTWDSSTIVEALPSGADSSSVLEFWYGKDSAGNEFAIRDMDGDADGEYYMWDGSDWDLVPFTGMSIEGSSYLRSAQIIDGELYIHGGGDGAFQYSGSGLSWGTEVDLGSTESVGGTDGFTYDSYTDTFYEAYRDTAISGYVTAIFEATDTRSFLDDRPNLLGNPTSCGDGMLYMDWVDPSYSTYKIYQYNIDDDDLTEITEITQGYAPTCTYDSGSGKTTLYYSADDGTGNWTIYSIEGQHASTSTYYADADSDGYGNPLVTTTGTSAPSGYVADNTDCDDTDASVNPGATEIPYDGVDQDCDGSDVTDVDGDGYDSTAVSGGTDCDDTNSATNPGATDRCDGVDDNCSGDETDAVDQGTWYQDTDSDNYGDPLSGTQSCTQPSGYVPNNTDCDDSYAPTNPGATEVCDGEDNNCDEIIPSNEQDADEDGFMVCEDDCDDSRDDVNPDQSEQCDDIDHDCDGTPDNDIEYQTWYLDVDGDGYGDPLTGTLNCVQPGTNYTLNYEDCDDTNYDINPGSTEVYDGVDNNCNGLTDLEDPDCEIIWTDCEDMGSSKSVADVFMLPMVEEECTVEFSIGTSETPAELTLSPGTSLDMFFEGLDPETGYYAVELYDGSHTTFESHGTETEIFEGVDKTFFGHSGSGRETDYSDVILSMTTVQPTITLFQGDLWEEGRDGLTQLTDYTCDEAGDKVVINTEEGTIEMNPDENPDDTGTNPDDTGTPQVDDTGNGDTGGCEGCSSATTPEGALATTALAIMALLGVAKRRED